MSFAVPVLIYRYIYIFYFFFGHQEALNNAKAEAVRWQSLYEELRLSAGQLRENQHLKDEQLQQLQSQAEVQSPLLPDVQV